MNRLSTQFILPVIIILVIGMSVVSFSEYYFLKKEYEQELTENLKQLSSFAAGSSIDAILTHDIEALEHYADQLTQRPETISARFLDEYNNILASASKNKAEKHNSVETIIIPVELVNRVFGTLEVKYNTERATALARSAFAKKAAGYAALAIILALAILILVQRIILRPIHTLVDSTAHIANENYDQKIDVVSNNEIGALSRAFNSMTDSLAGSNKQKNKALKQLNSAVEHLEIANTEKSRFLANMSHEIRTPLTSIIGFSETLDNPDSSESERYIATRTIIRNSHHLQQMINDILDISKIEAGELQANLEDTSVFDILTEIESLFLANAQERNLDFTINYEYPIPVVVHTDPLRVRQVLINLCGNALKFTKEGGISIHCRYQKPNIVISITDSGIGMNKEQIKKVFNLFTQADSTTTRQFGGTGLGLPLSRKIANLLDGEVNAESIEGKGSRFQFHFFAGEQAGNKMTNSAISVKKNLLNSPHQNRLTLHGKILVVDDARDNQILITSILKRAGLTSNCVDNGQLALDALKTEPYDLIIMDKQMPVLDGISATKIIRTSGNNIPIIALTADAFEEDRQTSIDAGCNAYVTKPINRNLLLTTIEKLLKKDDKLSRSA